MEEHEIEEMSFDWFVRNFNVGYNKINRYKENKYIIPLYKPLVQPSKKGKGQVKWATRQLIKFQP